MYTHTYTTTLYMHNFLLFFLCLLCTHTLLFYIYRQVSVERHLVNDALAYSPIHTGITLVYVV